MSSNTSAPRKRSRDSASYSDDGDASPPPPTSPPQKRPTRATTKASDAQPSHRIQASAPSPEANEWTPPYDFEKRIMESTFLKYLELGHKSLTVPFERNRLEFLSFDLIKGGADDINEDVVSIDRWFASYPPTDSDREREVVTRLRKAWQGLRVEIYKPLAPSSFCRSSQWVHQQNGAAFINCLRPPERSGLPLNLLHPVFAEFLALLKGPPPDYSDAMFILAEKVAIGLCQEMPEPFDTEDGRLEKFKSIASPLFEEVAVLGEVKIGTARTDFGLERPRVGLVLVGEGKNEPGGGAGDPYMHVAASYDAWARRQSDSSTGCPCFVFCIDGPNILFGGGFRDNDVSVVEPLSTWCVMMPHVQLERERNLGRHLYALLCCLSDKSKFFKPLPSTTVCCPRIYNSFTKLDEQESVPLKFIEPFKNPWHRRRGVYDLLFRASADERLGGESSVLVKVPVGDTYGRESHALAGSARFAPRLLGTAGVSGAPTIYVMELLSKSEGWFHLVKPERPEQITQQQEKQLRDRGNALISFLSTNKRVHGDLRGCNIMCRLDGNDVDLRVLDWDWAGELGTARYPAALNTEAGYQGSSGGLIDASHDKNMLKKTLDDFCIR